MQIAKQGNFTEVRLFLSTLGELPEIITKINQMFFNPNIPELYQLRDKRIVDFHMEASIGKDDYGQTVTLRFFTLSVVGPSDTLIMGS